MDNTILTIIPIEIIQRIIVMLPFKYLCRMSSVCKELHDICKTIYEYNDKCIDYMSNLNYKCKCDMLNYTLNMDMFENTTDTTDTPIMNDTIYLYNNSWPKLPKSLILNYNNNVNSKFTYSNEFIKSIKTLNTLNTLIYIYFNQFPTEYLFNLLSIYLPETVLCLTFYNINYHTIIDSDTDTDKISINASYFRHVKELRFIYYTFDEHNLNFTTLSRLSLDSCSFILTEPIKEQLSNMETLELLYCDELYSQNSNLNYLKYNKVLYLRGCDVNIVDFKHFSTCKNLINLKINFMTNLEDDSPYNNISELGKSNIQCLKISDDNTSRMFENLNGLEHIKYLDLNNFNIKNILNKMNNHTLSLTNSNITDDKLVHLLGVKRLNLNYNKELTDIRVLGSDDSKIEILDISYNSNIKYIDNLHNLYELNIIGCNLMIPILNQMHKFNKTKLFIDNCFCENCRLTYINTSLQKYALNQKITMKCLYPDMHIWFHF